MTQAMTPSDIKPITAGQIGKLMELLAACLRKGELPSGPVQQVLEHQGDELANEWLVTLRRRVDALSNIIVRRVRPNRSRTPQAALDATGRKQTLYTDRKVVDAMPMGEGEETEVFFFKPDLSERNSYLSDDLEVEFALRGLVPADPLSVAAVNEDDPSLADTHPHGTHWKDADGKWCSAAFYRLSGDERSVFVSRGDRDWDGAWWFAGVRIRK